MTYRANAREPSPLAPYARASIRSHRRVRFGLGGLLIALGLAIVAIVVAAAPLYEMLVLGAVAVTVAILPGGLLVRTAGPPEDEHPLVLALEKQPERIRSTEYAWVASLGGYRRVAYLTLEGGRVHVVAVPSS